MDAGYHGEQHGLDVSVEPAQSAGETEERPDQDQTGGLMECDPQAGAVALEDTYQEKEDINGNKGTSTS